MSERRRITEESRVTDLSGRRHGRVSAVYLDGEVRVRWADGSSETVHEDALRIRFTSQSAQYGRVF